MTAGFSSIGAAELPGNNGMFDMLLAVNWVKQYIKYFGGNPKKIVAFGHGTGAAAALMLSLSRLTNSKIQIMCYFRYHHHLNSYHYHHSLI